MDAGIILLILVIGIGIFLVMVYNRLVALRQTCNQAWGDIDVQLKQRHDLVPNIVETVKGYAAHEKDTLENVTKARQQAIDASSLKGLAEAEKALEGAQATLAEAQKTLDEAQKTLTEAEAAKDAVLQYPSRAFVANVVREDRIKFFGIPRCGSYCAAAVKYDAKSDVAGKK